MKIEYVVTSLDIGGAELQVRDLATGMRARGHDVGVMCLLEPRALAESLGSAGVPMISLNLSRRDWTPHSVVKAFIEARSRLSKRAPDIIHAHMVHANLFTRLVAATLPGSRLVCTIHSVDEGGWIRDLGYRVTNWTAMLNTCISEAATQRFVSSGALPRGTLTVYNGVDCSRFASCSPRERPTMPFRWVSIGNITLAKDYPTLLRALARLDGCVLDIVGRQDLLPDLLRLAAFLGLEKRVQFIGQVGDVAAIMSRYDAFVLSSAWEGFGLAVAEAMAASLPVVVTDSGGPREIVGNDHSAGIVVPTSDPAALAQAMQRVMAMTPEERRIMGKRGRDRIASLFGMRACLDTWEAVYSGLVDSRPRGQL